MAGNRKDVIFPLVTAGIFTVDQLLKYKARKSLPSGGSLEPEEGSHCPVVLTNSHNEGAAMNLFGRHPSFVRGIAVGYTVTLTVLYICTLGLSGNTVLKAGLSILLGGAYSNTYDRLKDHYVTDYFSWNFGPKFLQQICWNIADYAITIGALMTALAMSSEEKD